MAAETGVTDQDRVSRVVGTFAANRATDQPRSVCSVSVELLGVSATCVTLMNGRTSTPVCASDDRATRLDDLQYSLGEGPSPDSYSGKIPVYEPDLGGHSPSRWQHFGPSALGMGILGVFAFPLQVGTSCVGVLTVYQNSAGSLSPNQEADGLVVADTIARSMLRIRPEGDFEALATDGASDGGAHRAEFHQASGMTAVQLSIEVSEAAVRIRAYAYVEDRTVAEVATDIVGRRLRMDDDSAGRDV
jgi:hypothetical protein